MLPFGYTCDTYILTSIPSKSSQTSIILPKGYVMSLEGSSWPPKNHHYFRCITGSFPVGASVFWTSYEDEYDSWTRGIGIIQETREYSYVIGDLYCVNYAGAYYFMGTVECSCSASRFNTSCDGFTKFGYCYYKVP